MTLSETGIGVRFGLENAFALEPEKLGKINDLLHNEAALDSSSMLLLNAKDDCLEENHRLAIIEVVAGLEVVLYKFINVQEKLLGLSNEELMNFIIKVGLSGNIKLVLKMLTKGLEQVDDEILKECTGAITVRNHIMHDGLIEVEAILTETRIAANKMVDYLRRITFEVTAKS
jgi:hypothetical protein